MRAARVTLALIALNLLVSLFIAPGDAERLAEREAELDRIAEWSLRQPRRSDPELDAHQRHLWTLMREEARAADAELIDA